MADPAAIDAAVIAALATDPALSALLPDGVFIDVAPANGRPTRFVIVTHQFHVDAEGFGAPLFQRSRYRVTARALMTAGVDINAAAARIHAVLYDAVIGPIAGYTHMGTDFVDRTKYIEVDSRDTDVRWQIAGGDYDVHVSPD